MFLTVEIPAVLELPPAPGGTQPRSVSLPNAMAAVSTVLVDRGRLYLGGKDRSGLLFSRPLGDPNAWTEAVDSHANHLLRMAPWDGGIAVAGGVGWIDVLKDGPYGPIFCGIRAEIGQGDFQHLVQMGPAELWTGGLVGPDRVPKLYWVSLE